MNDVLKLVEAKAKAIKVIESCKTQEQLNNAKKYVDLFNNLFDDFLSYNELNLVLETEQEIINTSL